MSVANWERTRRGRNEPLSNTDSSIEVRSGLGVVSVVEVVSMSVECSSNWRRKGKELESISDRVSFLSPPPTRCSSARP